MQKTFFLGAALSMFCATSFAQANKEKMKPEDTEVWSPVPRKVTPGTAATAPSDAIVLFDGKNLDAWTNDKGEKAHWTIADNAMTVTKGGGIKTKQQFGSFQLHIEFRTPAKVVGEGQGRGNSGIFMQETYELQVLDSYESKTYSNGQAGSFYKQRIPLVNPTKGPGEWQVYDVIWTAPVFNADGILISKARGTVLLNGVVVQNNVELDGPTEYIGIPKYVAHGKKSIALQDHGNPVSFRNIWIREL